MPAPTRKLAAIMFTDIVGYTALMGNDEKKAFEILKKNRRIHWRLIKKYRGRWLKEMGDGTLASFSSSMDAVLCAISIQLAAKEMEIPLRIGIHQGDVVFEQKDVLGDGVNIASRIQGVAETQGIAISETTYQEIRNKEGLEVVSHGMQSLKGVRTPMTIYKLTCTDPEILDYKVDTGELVRDKRKSGWTGILFIALIALLGYYFIAKDNNRRSESDNSVLVLPPDNYTGTDTLDYFVAGMHDALIGVIGHISALRVISTTTARTYQDHQKSLPDIASELKVNKVIEPSVLCLRDSVCLRVKAMNAYPEEKQLWVQDFKVEKSKILDLYNIIAKEFSDEINVLLTPEEERLFARSKTIDNQAYDLYMKGMVYNDQMSEEALTKAYQYFKLANDIDPNWAAPYQGMASVFERQYQMDFIERSVMMPKLDAYLNKALELDPNSSWVYNLRGSKFGWFGWDWEKAEQDFLKSIELNPNHAGNHAFYAGILSILRKPDKALYHAKKAVELDPLNPFILGLCTGPFIEVGQCQSALDLIKKANSIEKKHYFAYPRLIETSICIGDFQTAFEVMKEINFELWEKYELTAHFEKVFLEKGWYAFLEELIFISEEVWSRNEDLKENQMANLYLMVGKYDKALEYFDKAYEIHSPNIPYISSKSNYNKMKGNPRYIELLKKLNLPVD